MDFIQNKIDSLAGLIVQPRKYYYTSDIVINFLQNHPNIKTNQFQIKNNRNQILSVLLLRKSYADTCIIYAHGLGSNKNQAVSLAKNLYINGFNYDICSFDFSGSGKSQGNYTTYGLLQQDDVNSILLYLDSLRKYSKFILWGRSMGAASMILSQSKKLHKKVQCMILDSPFSSFQKASIQIASKNLKLPQVLMSLLFEPLKEYFQKNLPQINPLSINIAEAISTIKTRIMLIYSKDDSIVNYEHSKQIGKYCQRNPIELQITEDHNRPRTKQTYSKAFTFISESIKMFDSRAKSRSKSKGISVTSKQNMNSNSQFRNSFCSSQKSSKKTPSLGKKFRMDTIGTYKSKSEQIYHINTQPNSTIIKSLLYEGSNISNQIHKVQTSTKLKKQNLRVSMKLHKQNFKTSTALFG